MIRAFLRRLADKIAPIGSEDEAGFHLAEQPCLPPDFHAGRIGATPEALRGSPPGWEKPRRLGVTGAGAGTGRGTQTGQHDGEANRP